MNLLVDTSVLIDVLRGRPGRAEILRSLVAQASLLCCCDITLAEVYAGMLDKERNATEELLDSLYYLPSEPAVARSAGHLRRDWRRRGATLTLSDTFIAALALHYGVALLTDNLKHFPMKELTVWTPESPPG